MKRSNQKPSKDARRPKGDRQAKRRRGAKTWWSRQSPSAKAIWTGVLIAIIAAPFVAILEDFGGLLSPFSPTTSITASPSSPTTSITASISPLYDSNHGWVFSKKKAELSAAPSVDAKEEEWAEWVQKEGGVTAAGGAAARVTIAGTSSKAVVLRGMSVTVHERRPPIQGTWVGYGGAGELSPRRFLLDLDKNPPSVQLIVRKNVPNADGGDDEAIDFPYTVSESDIEELVLYAHTTSRQCSWTATLHWEIGTEKKTTVIDNEGKPFWVTAPDAARERINLYGFSESSP
ncbi:hypothetical protein [Nonomuraea sp. 10N515B]|uniref:hypothetical protein n=1 Tax=Nonomuraea sp. 10N515B TaxID=3457422 RepID=UPI003FCE9ED0